MDIAQETEINALLRVIFDLRVPEPGQTRLQIKRPASLGITELSCLEELIDAIIREVMLSFDLRKKTAEDDPEEIEEWKKPLIEGGWVERRRNHRLRIRTTVDDLFEKTIVLPEMPATVRAWRIQVVDECADAILERYHLRPASSGPWALYRRTLYEVGQDLQQALGCTTLFLMTGRTTEIRSMMAAVDRAHQATSKLLGELEEDQATTPPPCAP
jgi:hypothetical protein